MCEDETKCEFLDKIEELAKCKSDCRSVGHYRCWKDDCRCICHAAQRVLKEISGRVVTPPRDIEICGG